MWSNRLILAGAVAFVAAASGVPVHAQDLAVVPCEDSIGIALVDVPAARQSDPRARTYIVDHVEPGTTLERRVRVCNGTDVPVSVQVYAGAATVEGDAFRAVEGRVTNELSGWIRVEPGRLVVAPRSESIATAVISVPSTATAGERYAAILVEAPAVQQPSGLSVASRVGVRVYLSVGGPVEPSSDFVIDSLQAVRQAEGRPAVLALVRNTGERALDLRGDLRLTEGPGGLAAGPFPATLGTTLLPEDTAPVTVVLDKAITGGPWTATLTLTSGLLERRARAVITFPDDAGEQAAPVDAENLALREDPKVLIPIAGGLIGLIALLLLFLLLRRRSKRQDDEDEDGEG